MTPAEARRRFAAARVARLATADPAGVPHLVPFVFAVVTASSGDCVYSVVDHKPKRTTALRRLANVATNPAVAALVDHYDDSWAQLWWARADGRVRVVEVSSPEGRRAVEALAGRYPDYRGRSLPGPVLAIDVTRWSGWSAT